MGRVWDLVSGNVKRESQERLEEANRIVESVKNRYEKTQAHLEAVKKSTEAGLNSFGQYQLQCLSSDIKDYADTWSSFTNLQQGSNLPALAEFNLPMNNQAFLSEIKLSSYNAFEIITMNALPAGAGALAAVGAYGCGMLIGTTEAGVALSALTGIAKGKAFLAWLGGGSMISGAFVLAGIAFIPFNVIGGLIMESKSKAKLAEARKIEAQVEEQIQLMKTGIAFCNKITNLKEHYMSFLQDFLKLFKPVLYKLKDIRDREQSLGHVDQMGKIDYMSLPEDERKTLHISWLMVQIYNSLLKKPLLNDKEEISEEAVKLLDSAKDQQRELLPSLIELADNGTVDIRFIKTKRIWNYTDKCLRTINWIISILLIAVAFGAFFWKGFDIWLPARNKILFSAGLLISGLIGLPYWTWEREKEFEIGKISQKQRMTIKDCVQLLLMAGIAILTYILFGKGAI